MLLSLKLLNTYDVDARDAAAGTLIDTRFDETSWVLQGLVVNTRRIVGGRHVLVPAGAVRQMDTERQKLTLALPLEQVDNAPSAPRYDAAPPGERSTSEVLGFHIRASDDTFGHLDDMLIEPESWAIRYLLIDTRNWWPGPPVLVAPDWVSFIDWQARKLSMDVPAERIRNCPPYDPASPPTREYEQLLYRHYERREYWS